MKTKQPKTDPYGSLTYCIGSSDDFWCFDFHDNKNGTITLHAVINSETGHFIQDAESPITVKTKDAPNEARRLVDEAVNWMCDNEVEHDAEGWNQDEDYFFRSVHCHCTKTGQAIRRRVEMVRRPVITRNYL